ncbi:MCP four helix bundle domain-containing protein [Echinicola sp. 20G]|uniref:MCP four helix bundle domain-containing protein n=1 Tax=Echinicola sp. 20G TaxID=2781961 RepID=UPI001910E07A|nr:MCP four helix bundle domain-containing protein [Echinicola sp. 20G]
MKWAYSIKNRMTIAILLMVVFVSVFVKNILDEEHVADLSSSCATIYEDRLLPESYIFHLSEYLYKKQMMIDACQTQLDYASISDKNIHYNSKIDSILGDFEATYLTKDEELYLTDLKKNVNELYSIEARLGQAAVLPEDFQQAKQKSDQLISSASNNLNQLSEVQLTVGKQLNDDSKRIMAGSAILTKFETVILIVLGILINALVFGVISSRSKIKQTAHLN